jgi:hypothetical protein
MQAILPGLFTYRIPQYFLNFLDIYNLNLYYFIQIDNGSCKLFNAFRHTEDSFSNAKACKYLRWNMPTILLKYAQK